MEHDADRNFPHNKKRVYSSPTLGPQTLNHQLRKGAWLARSFTLSTINHLCFLLHPSCSRLPCDVRQNGATGVSNMAGKAARAAVERCGKQPRYNDMTTTSYCNERAVFFSTRGRA